MALEKSTTTIITKLYVQRGGKAWRGQIHPAPSHLSYTNQTSMFCFSNDVSIETSMTTTGDALRLLVIARFQLMVNGERGRGTTTTKSTWMKHNQPFWQNGHVNGKQKATVTQRMRSPLHSVIS